MRQGFCLSLSLLLYLQYVDRACQKPSQQTFIDGTNFCTAMFGNHGILLESNSKKHIN